MLTTSSLHEIMPRVPRGKDWTAHLDHCLVYADAHTIPRAAALLAQVAHESGECRYMRELGDGKGYEGRQDLGNVQVGDGPKFKGRGLVQITGRKNYVLAELATGVPLVSNPELAADPEVAAKIVGWYWGLHGLNEYADMYDFKTMTRKINGGLNGWNHRVKYYIRALRELGRQKES